MPKCDFNKVALKLHFGMCVFLKICCIFSEHLLLRTPQVAAYEERLRYRFFPVSFPKFLQIFFKHTSGRLLRKEHWNSLKWCQYLSLLMFVSLVYQKQFVLFSFPRLLTANQWKFPSEILSKFFWYLDFFYLLILSECIETAFLRKFPFFFF